MRLTQHLKGWETLGISSSSSASNIKVCSSLIKPEFLKVVQKSTTSATSRRFLNFPCINCFHSHQSPIISDSSIRPNDYELDKLSEGLPTIAGGIVALGKFDALHLGHRELAIQAAKAGTPFLLSFVGIAEVLGWEPRPPIVAKCDRERVLFSWASLCGNVAPKEFTIDFSRVRHLTPRQFVEKLSKELGVRGVVAGENYRFGFKAAGDASELVRLCDEYGMKAYIINSIMDKYQDGDSSYPLGKKDVGQVSSTRVRYALSKGEMNYVSKLLGRPHRLILSVESKEALDLSRNRFSAPKSCLLNLAPKEGWYKCSLIGSDEINLLCRVLIDSTHIHLEADEKDSDVPHATRGLELVGIEFRG